MSCRTADTWYEKDYEQWDYETVVKAVYEVYAPAVELATKLGIKIAMEALYEWLGNDSHRTRLCSYVEELNDVIGKFDCDTVGVCWDFDHAAMTYREGQFEAMKRLKYPIIATHAHDNTFKYDNHNLPFQGSINWEEGMRTLAEHMEKELKISHVRIAGARNCKATRIALCFGSPQGVFDLLKQDDVQMVLTGETCEWQLGEYARDAAALGMNKSLIVMGHIGSERDGMRLLAKRMKEYYAEFETVYFECGEVYSYV